MIFIKPRKNIPVKFLDSRNKICIVEIVKTSSIGELENKDISM